MPPRHDEAPELAPPNFPEVHLPPSGPEAVYVPLHAQATPVKLEESTNPSTINAAYAAPFENSSSSPYTYDLQSAYGAVPPTEQGKAHKRILGCSILVFTLSVIIAILSAAVIGLAAGTGVEANRANDAEARLASMTSSPTTVTVTAPTSTSSGFSNIDKGCSTNSASVTGSTYTSQFFDRPAFKIYCNSDAPNNPLSSLFVGDFDDCIDACASYSFYIPSDFSNNATSNNATCAGVSFIPAWTNRTFAVEGNAPGNCYLKPGPQNETALNNPNIGSAVHAAILDTSS
ncbi:uncharacterized protein F4807DRAFT_150827 [Annulohypoxylon truncatum]|uniref:uncharacterized protein n=1 Tax=Annulohypoxylon truncatum TaxID=327061 RepID=UPI0020079B0D|nr:uncharacterized protein F4807DRAFT_150827 [Annulohypoxylon truncatum]KAI1208400.1 hypothetical protein F4807DRAFT_150827 [Annulohypoxylon truncatum]